MSQEFFTTLPSHIIFDILSRLPVRTIVRCKCVCKLWLNILKNHEFVNHHLSISAPGLAVLQLNVSSKLCKIYDFEDEHGLEHHELHYNPVTTFDLPCHGLRLQGSANGLLFLRNLNMRPNGLFVCNPITREYIEIQCPQEFEYRYPQVVSYGFGASRVINGQHKVVRVFHDCIHDQETKKWHVCNSMCHVYTLGTGSWRSIAPGAPLLTIVDPFGAFFNGNLHWLGSDSNGYPLISSFDLETEAFSIIALPPLDLLDQQRFFDGVFAFGDCLCVSDNSSDDEIVIWLMKEYRVEKSWKREFVIKKPHVDFDDISGYEPYQVVNPIKVFKDGEMLMAWGDFFLFYSSTKTGTITEIDMFGARSFGAIESILHTSSFLSLKNLEMEKLCSF